MEEKKESIEEQRKKLSEIGSAAMEEEDAGKVKEALYGYVDLITRTLGQMRPYEVPLIWAALNQTSEALLADMSPAATEVAQGFLEFLHATYAAQVTGVKDDDTM